MLTIPPELARRYTILLERNGIAAEQRPHLKKWLRYYLDFCHKYAFDPTDKRTHGNRVRSPIAQAIRYQPGIR
jgi:hypothetical protein